MRPHHGANSRRVNPWHRAGNSRVRARFGCYGRALASRPAVQIVGREAELALLRGFLRRSGARSAARGRARDRQDDALGGRDRASARERGVRVLVGAAERRRGAAVVRRADRPARRGRDRGAGRAAARRSAPRWRWRCCAPSPAARRPSRTRSPLGLLNALRALAARRAAGGRDRRRAVARRAVGRGAGVRRAPAGGRAGRVPARQASRSPVDPGAGARAAPACERARASGR